MTICTSYYANWRKFPKETILFIISRTFPRGEITDKARKLPCLYPSETLFNLHKAEAINKDKFKEMYIKGIEKYFETSTDGRAVLNIIKQMHKEKTLYLFLCYEGKNKFCHRRIFADWFEEKFKLKIEEL